MAHSVSHFSLLGFWFFFNKFYTTYRASHGFQWFSHRLTWLLGRLFNEVYTILYMVMHSVYWILYQFIRLCMVFNDFSYNLNGFRWCLMISISCYMALDGLNNFYTIFWFWIVSSWCLNHFMVFDKCLVSLVSSYLALHGFNEFYIIFYGLCKVFNVFYIILFGCGWFLNDFYIIYMVLHGF